MLEKCENYRHYRYIICEGLKPDSKAVQDYMMKLNMDMNSLKGDEDFACCLPLDVLTSDPVFMEYITNHNQKYVVMF